MATLARGFADVIRAVPYMARRPKLLRLVIAPFALALVIAGLLLWWLSTNVDPLVHGAIARLPGFLTSAAGDALRVLLWAAALALTYVAFLAFVSVLTTPFCEMISEQVEEEETGASATPFSWKVLARDLALGVAHSLRRLALFIASFVGLFLISTIFPFIGPVVALGLGGYVSARFAAYDCHDTIWARKGTAYEDKKTYLREHRPYTTGLGLAVAGAALIPVVNALAFPLGTIAATRSYVRKS